MASPYTIAPLVDVGIGATTNIMDGETGRTLVAPAQIQIALNRENVNVLYNVFIGSERVLVNGRTAVQAALGVMPILPDDNLITSFGQAGDEIVINAQNNDAVASEARAIVRVPEVDDVILQRAFAMAQGA